jgi:hypothetical protein
MGKRFFSYSKNGEQIKDTNEQRQDGQKGKDVHDVESVWVKAKNPKVGSYGYWGCPHRLKWSQCNQGCTSSAVLETTKQSYMKSKEKSREECKQPFHVVCDCKGKRAKDEDWETYQIPKEHHDAAEAAAESYVCLCRYYQIAFLYYYS